MRVREFFVVLLAVGVVGALGTPAQAQVQDAFQCWKIKDQKNPPFLVDPINTAADEFGAYAIDIKQPSLVCGPAELNGTPISDPSGPTGTHLCCYKGRPDPKKLSSKPSATIDPVGTGLSLGNPQSTSVQVKKRDVFCVPCTLTLLP